MNHNPSTIAPLTRWQAAGLILLVFLISRGLILSSAIIFGDGNPGADLCRWDCAWYLDIAANGYESTPRLNGEANWAFFPLFPELIAIGTLPTLWSTATTAYAINNVALLAASWVLYLLTTLHLGQRGGLITTTLFLCSPFSLYSSVPYTEAIFNLLSVLALYTATSKRWLISGFTMSLLTATRPTGIFAALSIILIAAREHGFRSLLNVNRHPRLWLTLALSPLGIAAYALYLHHSVGDALAFAHVQIAWGRELEEPLTRILKGLARLDRRTYFATAGVIGLAATLFLLRRGFLAEAVFLGTTTLVAAASGLDSLFRYVLGIWPAYICLGLLLRDRPKLAWGLAAGFLVGLFYYSSLWTKSHPWLV